MIRYLLQGEVAFFILLLTTLIVSLSLHEFGHAFAAKMFGDNTAQRLGRLTINPIAHIDPVGLLMLMLVGFGYAKPVPTDPRNYTSIWAQLVVAAAGPLANLLIAVVVINFYAFGVGAGWASFQGEQAASFFYLLAIINLILMLFNLIPFGPLDGHYILPYFLPKDLARQYNSLNDQYGSMIFMGLILLSILGVPIFSFVLQLGQRMLPYIIVL